MPDGGPQLPALANLLVLLAAALGGGQNATASGGTKAPATSAPASYVSGVPTRISDGDSLVVGDTRVRLFGIDAPELAQECLDAAGAPYPCGEVSRDALIAKIGGSEVRCEEKDTDQFDRMVAVCYLPLPDGTSLDLNGWMVEQGLAVAYRRYTDDYVAAEEAARQAQRGMWAGEFQEPEDFRRNGPPSSSSAAAEDAAEAEDPQPPAEQGAAGGEQDASGAGDGSGGEAGGGGGCYIKGNISRSTGEKIFHVPGSPTYDSVVIDESQGERWFCSEAEAEAAGWRAPR